MKIKTEIQKIETRRIIWMWILFILFWVLSYLLSNEIDSEEELELFLIILVSTAYVAILVWRHHTKQIKSVKDSSKKFIPQDYEG